MMPSPLSLLYIVATLVYVNLAMLVVRRNVRSQLNWACALLLFALAIWSFEDIFHGNPALPPELVNRFSDVGTVGRFSFASLFLWFAVILTHGRRFKVPTGWRRGLARTLAAVALIGVPLPLMAMLWTRHFHWTNHHYAFGWVVVWSDNVWSLSYYTYYATFVLLGCYLLFRFARRAPSQRERRQAGVILVATVAAGILGTLSDVVFPNVLHAPFPELAGVLSLIWAGGLYFGVTRYGLMSITPTAAADGILAAMADTLLLLTPDDRVAGTNEAATELLGHGREELVGTPAERFFAVPEQFHHAQDAAKSGVTLRALEFSCRSGDGREVPVSASIRAVRNRQGELTGVVWVLRDMTKMKWTEEALRQAYDGLELKVQQRTTELSAANQALRESEDRYRQHFERANDVIYTLDHQFRVTSISPSVQRLLGYAPEELIGKRFPVLSVLSLKSIPRALADAGKVLGGETIKSAEYEFITKDGTRKLGEVSGTPLIRDGRITGTVSVARDVTERRHAEQELEQHRQHLEQLVEERTADLKQAQEQLLQRERLATLGQVAGSIAHDLRNPLGIMSNSLFYLNAVLTRDLPAKVFQHLGMMEKQVARANGIIATMLDFGKGRPAERRPCPIHVLLDDSLADLPVPEGIKVEREEPAGISPVLVDPAQMRMVFVNLIKNAIQAMPEGGRIRITVDQKPGDAPAPVRVALSDSGHGITPDALGHVFEAFFTTRESGTGLGLAIVKSFVERNEGKIEVQSEVNKGTTFTLTLPAAPAQPPDVSEGAQT